MSNEFEQPVEPMSRTEEILREGNVQRPMSRVEDLLQQLITSGTNVSITPTLSTGVPLAYVTINGVDETIYAPEDVVGSIVTVSPVYESGILIATITVNEIPYYIYIPNELPSVSSEDSGKVLTVNGSGQWTANNLIRVTDVRNEAGTSLVNDGIATIPDGVEYVEMNKAQYDAMTYEQKMDPEKLYFVPDTNAEDEPDYYGFILHQANSNPETNIEYIGKNLYFTPMVTNANNTGAVNMGSWGEMPTIRKSLPAVISCDGVFQYWLDPNDYTKKLDGTASDLSSGINDVALNCFSWFEPLWMKITESGTDIEVRFAYSQLDEGYEFITSEGNTHWIPMFYGSPDSSGRMRSWPNTNVLGGVTNNTATDIQHTAILANSNDHEFFGGKLIEAITLLQMMWFKSSNSDSWCTGSQNGYNSSAAYYGTKMNPILNGGAFYCTKSLNAVSANKILHSIVLGTFDVFVRDPFLLLVNETYKVSKDYTYDITGATYTDTGITAPSSGFQGTQKVIPGFGIVPITTGGSASSGTTVGDYIWTGNSGVMVTLRFGYCGNGRLAGCRRLGLDASAGASDWTCGCALILKQPLANIEENSWYSVIETA